MRRYVGPLIALVVFVILLAIVLVTQSNGSSTATTATTAVSTPAPTIDPNMQVLNLPATDTVSELDIQGVTTTVKLKLNNGEWQQIAPTTAEVSSATISDTIQQLTAWTASSVVSPSLASNLANFGLDKPSLTVTIVASSGPKVFLFGILNPATNNYYVKRQDDPRVWAVSSFVVNTLTTWETAIPTPPPTIAITGGPLTPLPTLTPSPSAGASTDASTTTLPATPAPTSTAGPTGSPGVGITLAPGTPAGTTTP